MKRIISFDILKSICILFVIITHFISLLVPDVNHQLLFPFYIDMAVPMFLIITGYTHCKSLEKSNPQSTINCYDKNIIKVKFQRALVPYIMTLLIELILMFFIVKAPLQDFVHIALRDILMYGAWGHGGYYPIIFIQILLWFPIMYQYFKRKPLYTFIVTILLNIGFEIFAHNFLTIQIYRLLSFRYLTFVLFGMFLCLYKERIAKTYIPQISLVIGLIYLIYVNYIDYTPTFYTWWTNTTMIAAFYAFSIIYYFLKLESFFQKTQKLLAPLSLIGKSSYQILFVQMIFFGPMQLLEFNLAWLHQHIRLRYLLFFTIFICITLGCIWYKLETIMQKKHTIS